LVHFFLTRVGGSGLRCGSRGFERKESKPHYEILYIGITINEGEINGNLLFKYLDDVFVVHCVGSSDSLWGVFGAGTPN
jgi:hypothetical protein